MTHGFLLRFLESPFSGAYDDGIDAVTSCCHTTTRDNRVNAPLAGTKTLTEIKREQADQDPTTQSSYTLPK